MYRDKKVAVVRPACSAAQILLKAHWSAAIILLCLAGQVFAGGGRIREEFYRNEFQNWKEYIGRFQDCTPDSSFDVTFYHLDVDIGVESPFIGGNVLCEFDVGEPNLQAIRLNLHESMTIDSITGSVNAHTFGNDTINIELDRIYQPGESAAVRVFYHGIPELAGGYKGLRYETHRAGEPVIATLSTPFLSHYWWPCRDGPGDKPDSVYIDITIPDTTVAGYELVATSNGVLEQIVRHDGRKTFEWRERYPVVPYYVMAAISNYRSFQQVYSGFSGKTFPIDYFVFSEDYEEAQEGVARLPEAIALFSSLFGAYPFEDEKYGMTQLGYYGAIENQTNTIQNSLSIDWFEISVHELAHMWFGDMITCRDWHHGWLNEGFATYCEALWAEHAGGFSAYRDRMSENEYFYGGTLYLEDISDPFNIFIGIIYQKGAYVLHMLRHVMGDADFFEALYCYAQAPELRYGHAVTDDFKQICEQVGAADLDFFFDQWIYDEYYPVYEYSFSRNPQTHETKVDIEQIQGRYGWRAVFEMPVDLKFGFTGGEDSLVTVWNDRRDQRFTFDFADAVDQVTLDPDDWILKRASQVGVEIDAPGAKSPEFSLGPNYPNPFNPVTVIPFSVAVDAHVDLRVYDLRGREVGKLVNGVLASGSHQVAWYGRNESGRRASSGVYIMRLKAEGRTLTRKILLMK